MNEIKNTLLVTNTTTEPEIILIKEAIHHAKHKNLHIKLSLAHIIPNLPVHYFTIPSMASLMQQLYDEAEASLTFIGKILGIEKRNQWLVTGRVVSEVPRLARRLRTQFILASRTNLALLHQSPLVKNGSNAFSPHSFKSLSQRM